MINHARLYAIINVCMSVCLVFLDFLSSPECGNTTAACIVSFSFSFSFFRAWGNSSLPTFVSKWVSLSQRNDFVNQDPIR